eukprot:6205101-Pleurochrysis_carterae.AAC.2
MRTPHRPPLHAAFARSLFTSPFSSRAVAAQAVVGASGRVCVLSHATVAPPLPSPRTPGVRAATLVAPGWGARGSSQARTDRSRAGLVVTKCEGAHYMRAHAATSWM